MLVEVTAEDIKNGACGGPYYCPVAIALSRALKNNGIEFSSVIVIGPWCRIANTPLDGYYECDGTGLIKQTSVNINMPPEVKKFVSDFDYKRNVEPFSFELPIG